MDVGVEQRSWDPGFRLLHPIRKVTKNAGRFRVGGLPQIRTKRRAPKQVLPYVNDLGPFSSSGQPSWLRVPVSASCGYHRDGTTTNRPMRVGLCSKGSKRCARSRRSKSSRGSSIRHALERLAEPIVTPGTFGTVEWFFLLSVSSLPLRAPWLIC
jgi:hypothetical protein